MDPSDRPHVLRRSLNRFEFALEQFVQRSPVSLLLLAAGMIVFVAVLAGVAVWWGTDAFKSMGEAIWWAFLRLSDPGYLGDDKGAYLRAVSTIVTVLGYVLFMGTLVAIMTQWLNNLFRRLESGLTPIALEDHVLVLGWTSRTPAIVHELMHSTERVRRFLKRVGADELQVVVLSEDAGPAQTSFLRDRLGRLYDPDHVLVRQGTPLRIEHLRRVDFLHAAAIVLPAPDHAGGATASQDGRALKALMSTAVATRELPPEELPLVVTEVLDATKLPLMRAAYGGPMEILASDAFIARILAQTMRHRGLSLVTNELLSHAQGNEIYIRPCPTLVGLPTRGLFAAFPTAVPIGLVRPAGASYDTVINPVDDEVVGPEDKVALLAESRALTEVRAGFRPADVPPLPDAGRPALCPMRPPARRVLVAGWNHRVPALLRELDGFTDERLEVVLLSRVPVRERDRLVERQGVPLQRIDLRNVQGDHTSFVDLGATEPHAFSNVVLLASDRLETEADADARTLLGYMVLRALLDAAPGPGRPEVVVELMDPASVGLVPPGEVELVVSSTIVSHMLTQVALRRELRAVFDELYGPGGTDITFRPASDYALDGREIGFVDAQAAAAARGDVALGFRIGGQTRLNPDRARRWTLSGADELVVLAG